MRSKPCPPQYLHYLFAWAEARPEIILGDGPEEARVECLRAAMDAARMYWTKKMGVLRPRKRKPMMLDVLVKALKSLDLRSNSDLRDSLAFVISFVCGARGKEIVNLTWKDVTVLENGAAVRLKIRPTKTASRTVSTHSCQVGKRKHPQVR